MKLQGSLISTRCLVTIGHFVPLVLLFNTIGNNIVVTITREGGSQSLAVAQTTAALIVGVFCFAVDVISGIVMGHSLFHPVVCFCFLFSFIKASFWLDIFPSLSLCRRTWFRSFFTSSAASSCPSSLHNTGDTTHSGLWSLRATFHHFCRRFTCWWSCTSFEPHHSTVVCSSSLLSQV